MRNRKLFAGSIRPASERFTWLMRFRVAVVTAICLLAGGAIGTGPAWHRLAADAAAPAGGTVSQSNPQLNWTGAIMPANPDLLNSPRCPGGSESNCDNFNLTVVPPAASYGPYIVEVRLQPQGDWDMEVYNPDGKYRTSSGNGVYAAEIVTLFNPPAGTYRIAAFPFSPVVGPDGNTYAATARLLPQPPSGQAPAGTAPVDYANFACPANQTCTGDFGEPSIGVNWKTNNVMFAGGGFPLQTFRVNNFNDKVTPATATWTNVGVNQHIATSPRVASDPILFTDPITGRTFAGQEEGLTPFATVEYSDDDGNLFVPTQGSGVVSGVDHETIGGGPLAAPLTRDPSLPAPYPHGVYYCAQALGPANCALSLDGGATYGPAMVTWTTECGGLHGHLKVSPKDGTIYLPNRGCGGRHGLAVSTDNGVTWAIRTIPGTATGESDPSIGISTDGTVYYGFVDGDGHPKIAVSHDKGVTWDTWNSDRGLATFVDVGAPFGLQNAVFADVVAGDPDRAAFAFHGSPMAGPFQDASFNGVWDLYVAHTFDGGRTWTTVKATRDPIQRGCIWLGGGSNPCRNLLDFMDMTIDVQGRVMVGFADGCTGACAADPNNMTKSVWATIARQSSGLGVFSAFDPQRSFDRNVTSMVALQTSNPSSSGGISSYNLAMKNISAENIVTPLRLEISKLSSASGRVTVANSDNAQGGVGANWSYSSLVGADNVLTSSELSGLRNLKFSNPANEAFTATFSVIETLPNNDWILGFAYQSSEGSGGGTSSGGGSSGSAPNSASATSATGKLLQITYNPVLNTVSVQLLSK